VRNFAVHTAMRPAVIAAPCTADVTDTHRLVVNHIAAIRKIPGLQDAMAVLVLESNLACAAQHVNTNSHMGFSLACSASLCTGTRRSMYTHSVLNVYRTFPIS
jgi:hypothetical protein